LRSAQYGQSRRGCATSAGKSVIDLSGIGRRVPRAIARHRECCTAPPMLPAPEAFISHTTRDVRDSALS